MLKARTSNVAQFSREDYYDVLKRREASTSWRAIGSRTQLRIDSELEDEFLDHSSEDDRPKRSHPLREHYASLAVSLLHGVCMLQVPIQYMLQQHSFINCTVTACKKGLA